MEALVRAQVLRQLGRRLGPGVAFLVARRYLETLEERVGELERLLVEPDVGRAYAVADSLAASSRTVGALAMAERAEAMARSLREGVVEPVRDTLPDIRDLAVGTAAALHAVIDEAA